MKRTVRASPEQWKMLALCGVLTVILLGVLPFVRQTDRFTLPLLLVILVLGNVWIVLETVFSRVMVDAHEIVFRSPLPSRRLRIVLADVLRYHSGREKEGEWRIETEGRTTMVPVQNPWGLHAALVEFAPTKLGAKRLRPLHLPPAEDFTDLWTLDTDLLVSEAVLKIVICLVLAVAYPLARPAAIGSLAGLLILTSFRVWGRLDVTGEGLVQRGPLGRTSIAWSSATAIFCENPRGRRSFVITAPGVGIEIPPHLAKDVELMRKTFRSLPEGTLCVNFDETTFRGYRRRKRKAKEPIRGEDLFPALTA